MKKFLKSLLTREKLIKVILPIVLVIALAVIGFFSFGHERPKNISPDEAKTKAEAFINEFLMASGSKATIKEVTKEYGLYKLKIDVVSEVVDSYLSRDGKLFFPQALNIDEITASKNTAAGGDSAANASQATEVSIKNDKPVVELFVMSYCPYGTQIEKGILPVVTALGKKIDFQLKFVSYAMHGEKELKENLLQYCIEKTQPEKLNSYLSCFLESDKSADCLDKSGVKTSKTDSCMSSTDKEFKITENFKNNVGYSGDYPGFNVQKADNEKYNVAGSPTLIINGQEISSGRDAASLLKTICSAFSSAPQECQTELSSATPTPGFGSGTTSGTAAADCGQ